MSNLAYAVLFLSILSSPSAVKKNIQTPVTSRNPAQAHRNLFTATNDENDSFDNRSDNKGPEPEAVEIAEIAGRIFAGGLETGTAGPLGPEGLRFVPGEASPVLLPLLLVANEVSGTTDVYVVLPKLR